MKEFKDDNFKFDENGINVCSRIENTVRKGEIARYVLFSQCFQKICTADTQKQWTRKLFGLEIIVTRKLKFAP